MLEDAYSSVWLVTTSQPKIRSNLAIKHKMVQLSHSLEIPALLVDLSNDQPGGLARKLTQHQDTDGRLASVAEGLRMLLSFCLIKRAVALVSWITPQMPQQ